MRSGWHRFHFPIGVFVVFYGVAHLALPGTPLPFKAVEAVLLFVVLAGLLRRNAVWFLPGLLGWSVAFVSYAVKDGIAGEYAALGEHVAYALVFAGLLALAYALRVKALAPAAQQQPLSLSRTQEIALSALSRWQRLPPQA
jgi:hypothetical protein